MARTNLALASSRELKRMRQVSQTATPHTVPQPKTQTNRRDRVAPLERDPLARNDIPAFFSSTGRGHIRDPCFLKSLRAPTVLAVLGQRFAYHWDSDFERSV